MCPIRCVTWLGVYRALLSVYRALLSVNVTWLIYMHDLVTCATWRVQSMNSGTSGLKHIWNIFETCLKHIWNIFATYLKHIWFEWIAVLFTYINYSTHMWIHVNYSTHMWIHVNYSTHMWIVPLPRHYWTRGIIWTMIAALFNDSWFHVNSGTIEWPIIHE